MRNWPSVERTVIKEEDGKPVQMGAVVVHSAGDSRRVTFRASTFGVDRHGTRVRPMGIDTTNYEKNPIFLWGHDGYGGFFSVPSMDNVLGRVASFKKSLDAFDIDVDFAPAEANPKAEMALRLVQGKFLNAVSIGFIPRQIVVDQEDDSDDIPQITKSELLEVSLVPIPSNPDALALSRSMMDLDLRLNTKSQLGWVCRHGQFYQNPSQADACHGHSHDTPPAEKAADNGLTVVQQAFQAANDEFAVRRAFRSTLR